jgi:hypothetical protein
VSPEEYQAELVAALAAASEDESRGRPQTCLQIRNNLVADYSINYFHVKEGNFPINASLQRIGEDYLLSIWGGKAHIGAVAMAQPRPSLARADLISATASVFCYLGHKEDELVKRISEKAAAALGTKVVVTAGIHWDNISSGEIDQIVRNVDALIELILSADVNEQCANDPTRPNHAPGS